MPHHDRVYHGDPLAATGVWGTPSSRANFCEEDYAVTKYIAEFANTLSNLAYVYYALKSPCRASHNGKYFGMDAMAFSLFLVGMSSLIFHATLHQETQFMDEISMFMLGSALLQPLYTTGFKPSAQKAITTVLISLVVGVSAVYYQKKDVLIHLVAFTLMENLISARLLYLVYFHQRSAVDRSRLVRQFWAAVGIMALAIAVWLIDLELCYPLRAIRGVVGSPWAFLFELHGWWHILTAVAASKFIALVREICL